LFLVSNFIQILFGTEFVPECLLEVSDLFGLALELFVQLNQFRLQLLAESAVLGEFVGVGMH